MVIIDKLADQHDDIVLNNYIKEQKRALGIPVSPISNTNRKTTSGQSG